MNDSYQREERISIARLLSQVVDQQQQSIMQFNTIAAALESIRVEVRRTDENHSREVDRLHEIIRALLPQQQRAYNDPHQVYNACASPATFFGDTNTMAAHQLAVQNQQKMMQLQLSSMNGVPPSNQTQYLSPKSDSGLLNVPPLQTGTVKLPSTAPRTTTISGAPPKAHISAVTERSASVSIKQEPHDSRDEISSDSSDGEPWEVVKPESGSITATSKVESGSTFGADFLKKDGEWECVDCYTRNKNSDANCVCCNANKEGTTAENSKTVFAKPVLPSQNIPSAKFSFGLNKGTPQKSEAPTPSKDKVSFTDAARAAAEEDSVSPRKSANAKATADPSRFSFGVSGSTSSEKIFGGNKIDQKPTFNFSLKKEGTVQSPSKTATYSGKCLFGASSSSSAISSTSDDSQSKIPVAAPKIFGTGSTLSFSPLTKGSLFSEEAKKKAHEELDKQKISKFGASLQQPAATSKIEEDENEESVEDYEPTAEFTPVCPLPDLVEVITGEEGEKVVFKERCKLYRYVADTKEWKERGSGEIKILLNEETKKARCVMRRDHTHKLGCNFRLTSGMTVSKNPRNEKAVLWVCVDFSEDTAVTEKLSARFGNAEKVAEFMKNFIEYCK